MGDVNVGDSMYVESDDHGWLLGRIIALPEPVEGEEQMAVMLFPLDGVQGVPARHLRAIPSHLPPATASQLRYLRGKGHEPDPHLTKADASRLIRHLAHPGCHYCGQPARSKGFFGENLCAECGG